jgi:lipopolysaccharide biosynthesis glycosyltransferase
MLLPGDDALLRGLGGVPKLFRVPEGAFPADAVAQFSLLALARFEGFRLLDRYRTVIWLDVDTAIQDDIAGLAQYGPLALALEDPQFTGHGETSPAGINYSAAVPGFDTAAPNLNSGVLVLQDTLPGYENIYRQCLDWLREYGALLRYLDQGILNLLAQTLQKRNPAAFCLLPHDRFNAHPRNPGAQHAAIVHAFGAYKLWDDGLTRCSFPEWERDYRRWLALGGSPWRGKVGNASYLEGGAFFMLRRLFDSCNAAQALIDSQQAALDRERRLRENLERLLARENRG